MTNENNQKNLESSEKASSRTERADTQAENKGRSEASKDFHSLSDQVKEQRKKQHESGKSGITGHGDKNGTFASATDILGDFAKKGGQTSHPDILDSKEVFHVSLGVKAELLKTGERAAKDAQLDAQEESFESAPRVAQLAKATETLLNGASDRFGKKAIAELNIAKGDVGAATSALLFGPGICKAMGPEQTSLVGKQLVVFGIAPMFGAANEAQKQFDSQNLQKTIHDGSGNFIAGTAIGAVLERAHPAMLCSAVVGGVAAITND